MTRPSWPPQTILVAVDSGQSAQTLVDRATTLALVMGARLVVVHAVCVRPDQWPTGLSSLLEGLEILDADAHAEVAALCARASASGVAVSSVVMHGEAARVLTEAIRTEHADLVVVGAHPRSGVLRMLVPDLRTQLTSLGSCGVLSLPLAPEPG